MSNVGRALAVALLVLHGACVGAMAGSHAHGATSDGTRLAGPSAKPGTCAPAAVPEYPAPYAALVVDVNSGRILHADKADELRHPASLTKMMTLFLLFEALEAGRLRLDSELLVSEHASMQERTNLNLGPGQTINVQDAILGLVVHSANDAAVVVAEAIGGTETGFAERMTLKARALGMDHTVYRNASGLPDEAQVTTARDQAVLGCALQARFPGYYPYFSTQSFLWRGKKLRNHNKLLGRVKGMDGIKTGYIRSSKFNLVASVRRNDRHIVAVILGGSTARARDARMVALIDQSLASATPRRNVLIAAVNRDSGRDEGRAGDQRRVSGPKSSAVSRSAVTPVGGVVSKER